MTQNSKIEWTDHTFNPWVGCTKVSPGCDHCYAESWAKRTGNANLWTGARRRTTPANWAQVRKWNREAAAAGRHDRVFCASMADVFDNEVPQEWRSDLFDLIETTPNLTWLLLTKRISNAWRMLRTVGWAEGQRNVWLGITVVNQEEADRDIPKLLAMPARVRFLSIEPMLGPINMSHAGAFTDIWWDTTKPGGRAPVGKGIDWVIAGGESGGNARPVDPAWIQSLRDQCVAARVPFLFKQWGEWGPLPCQAAIASVESAYVNERKVAVGQIGATWMFRGGKKTTGRELDGRTWDQFPERRV